MLTRRELAVVPLIAATAANATTHQAVAVTERADEVRALVGFAEQTHPRGLAAAADPGWRRQAEALANSAAQLDHGRYVVEVMRLLKWFNDGHTRVFAFAYPEGPFQLDLPVRTVIHADGLFVDWTGDDDSAHLLGARLERIGGRSVEELIRAFASVWPADNPAWAHAWAPELLHSPGLLHGLGFLAGNGPVLVHAITPAGQRVRSALRPRPGIHLRRGRDRGYNEVLGPDPILRVEERSTALIATIDVMADTPEKTFEQFTHEFIERIATTSADRVILDLRRNRGGNNFHGEPIRHRLQQSRFNRPGRLFALIGAKTFSAAQCLVSRLERETFVLTVGEPTGCSPNHFGDARGFTGAATGIRISVSTLNWQDMPPFDRRRWTAPDIPVPSIRAQTLGGHDAALEAALRASLRADWNEDRLAAPWARDSQNQPWRAFWMADQS